MTRALVVGLVAALTLSVAAAEPFQPPTDTPMKTDEKAGTRLENDASGGPVVSADHEREASIDFREGNDHLNNGLFPQAVEKYKAALVHWDHPAIHYNLALALINLDRPLEVHEHLNKAIAYGPDPLEKEKYEHARQYLRLVERQIADIEVSCDRPGARVAVDGQEVFVAPGKYRAKVRAGKHTFLAEKQGYIARSTVRFIDAGKSFQIELELYTDKDLTRYRRRWNRAWIPYGVVGAGALLGIAGGVLEFSARSGYQNYDAAIARCNDANATANGGCAASPSLQGMIDSAATKSTAGLVMYGLAGVTLVTGAVLVYVNRREAYHISIEDLAKERVSVTPVVAPGLAGALVQGHF